MTFDRCPLRRARSWSSSQPSRSISFLKCHSVLAQASPSVDTNFWRSWSSRKISSRWSPRLMTRYMAPGYSMRSLRDMANPYQYAPEVSIVRTDTCMYAVSGDNAGVSIGHPYRLRSSDLAEAFPGTLIARAPRRGGTDTNGPTSGCPVFVPAQRGAAPGAGVAQLSPDRLRGGLAAFSSAPFASLCKPPQTSPTVAI